MKYVIKLCFVKNGNTSYFHHFRVDPRCSYLVPCGKYWPKDAVKFPCIADACVVVKRIDRKYCVPLIVPSN